MRTIFASLAIIGGVFAGAPALGGDIAAGEKVFKKCRACHVVDKEKNKVGPHLVNVFGRKPGSLDGVKYSKGMIEFGKDNVWDEATMSAYRKKPRSVVKGTRMAFAGLRKEKDIENLIAYLKQFSE